MKRFVLVALTVISSIGAFAQTLQDAQNEMVNENYFKAKSILNKIIKDASASIADARYYLGNAYAKNDELDSARVFYKQVFNPDNRTPLGYVALGRLALLDKNKTEAKTNFDRALQLTKMKNASVYYEIGMAYAEIEPADLDAAITHLEMATQLDNKSFNYFIGLGDAYNAKSLAGDGAAGGKAMSAYQHASDLEPKAAMPWVKQGRIWLNGKVYDQAIESFNKAVASDPSNAVVYKELGTAYYLSKAYDKMLENFKKYLDLSPGDCRARLSIILVYWKNKDFEKVAEEATKGLACDANNFIFERYLYYSQYELKRYKEGYESMNKFWKMANIETRPTDYVYSARLASQVGDTTQAMAYFNTVLKDDSLNCEFLGDYAKILFLAKHYEEAVHQYEVKKANCKTFSNIDVFYMGRSYMFMNDSINADSTFSYYMQRFPTALDGYYWRAQVNVRYKLTSDAFAAVPFYQKYVELAEPNAQANKSKLVEAYQYLAIAKFEKDKDKSGALALLNKALELNPTDEMTTSLIEQLRK